MKISAKGRYGLAAMTCLARNFASGSPITIISISEKLGISKIYLEQVFSPAKTGSARQFHQRQPGWLPAVPRATRDQHL